jgi:hypothetical protein
MVAVLVTSTLPERRLSPFFTRVMLLTVSTLYSRVREQRIQSIGISSRIAHATTVSHRYRDLRQHDRIDRE